MKSFFFLFFLFITLHIKSQESILNDYIKEGISNNLSLNNSDLVLEKMSYDLKIARSFFFPKINAISNYTYSKGGRSLNIPTADLLNPVYNSLNTLSSSSSFPNIKNFEFQLNPNDFHNTKIEMSMPLFDVNLYYNFKIKSKLINIEKVKKEIIVNELVGEIKTAYYKYLKVKETIELYKEKLASYTSLVELNKSFVLNGLATKERVLFAEYELSKLKAEIENIKVDEVSSRGYFNFLLNKKLDSEILVASEIRSQPLNLKEDSLLSVAIKRSSDLKFLGQKIQLNKIQESYAKHKAFLPSIYVIGDYGFQGEKYRLNSAQEYSMVNFNLKWNLFEGGTKYSRVKKEQLNGRILSNELIRIENKIKFQVLVAYNEYLKGIKTLLIANESVNFAKEYFLLEQIRYELHEILLNEYLSAQNNLKSAELKEILIRYELNLKKVHLMKIITQIN